jgi:hypothetical protein
LQPLNATLKSIEKMNKQAKAALTAMAILIMPRDCGCDPQAVEKLTALTETKALARCATAGEAGLTSERTVHSHSLLAGNPAISCRYRTLRPEALRRRLPAGLPNHVGS